MVAACWQQLHISPAWCNIKFCFSWVPRLSTDSTTAAVRSHGGVDRMAHSGGGGDGDSGGGLMVVAAGAMNGKLLPGEKAKLKREKKEVGLGGGDGTGNRSRSRGAIYLYQRHQND